MATIQIKQLKDKDEDFFPVTHERAVRDDDGNTLESKLAALDDGAVRTDVAQSLTDTQKAQALANLGISGIDNKPTVDSQNLVTSGGVQSELALGAVYDVSAKNPTAGPNNDGKFESLSALLSDSNLNTLIPTSVRRGGMSIKFVQSSDNKYVQYRLMSDTFNTTVANWQGVDDEPTAGSKNLVKSGGVEKYIGNYFQNNDGGHIDFVDGNGNIAFSIRNNGVGAKQYNIYNAEGNLVKTISNEFLENLLFAVSGKADKITIGELQLEDDSNNLTLLDGSGNIALKINTNGICVSKINICDQNGDIIGVIDSSEVREDYELCMPDSIFVDVDSMHMDSFPRYDGGYVNQKRISAVDIYAERFVKENLPITLDGAWKTQVSYNKSNDFFVNGVLNVSKQLKFNGFGYKTKENTVNIIATKDSALKNKNLFMQFIGDSLTAYGEYPAYIVQLLKKRSVDAVDANITVKTCGTRHATQYCIDTFGQITYNGYTISPSGDNYIEGRSGIPTACYLRHADDYGWATANQRLLAWDALGLHSKYNRALNAASKEDLNLIGNTCSGMWLIDSDYEPYVSSYTWDRYKSKCGFDNVAWADATAAQKDTLLNYMKVDLLDTPLLPFYSKAKMLETNGEYAFDWNVYYSRYKTHEDDGVTELATKGSWITPESNVFLCHPTVIFLMLGTNDSVFAFDGEKSAQEQYQLASLIQSQTDIPVVVSVAADSTMKSAYIDIIGKDNIVYEGSKNYAFNYARNKKLIELCGNLVTQESEGLVYCPVYYIQGIGGYYTNKGITEYNGEETTIALANVHPNTQQYKCIGYEMYSLLVYMCNKNII